MYRSFPRWSHRRLALFMAVPCAAFAASIASAAPQSLCPLHPLTPSASPSAQFESGLASDGARLAATFVDGNSADVEIFERSGPTWTSRGSIGAATPFNRSELFGSALDLRGTSLLVAVPLAQGPVGNGVLRPFDETVTGWVARPDITTSHPFAQSFGDSFDRDSTIVVARSWFVSFASVDNRLHVFEETPTGAFVEVQVIDDPNQPPAGQGFSNFGTGIAIEGPWLVAGGFNEPVGRAYVWQRAPLGGFTLLHELVPPGVRSESYGNRVAVSGNIVAVADPQAPPTPTHFGLGAVHLFEYSFLTGTFNYLDTLRVQAPFGTVQVGESLALVGRRLAATYTVATISALPPLEGLAVFDAVGTLRQTVSLAAQDPAIANSAIGRTVRIAEGEAVTTDRSSLVGTTQVARGDLGRFTIDPVGLQACRGAANSTGNAASLTIAPCVSQLGFNVSLAGLPPSEPGVMLIGVGAAALRVGQGVLCIGQSTRVARFASSSAGTAGASIDHVSAGFTAGDVVLVQAWYRDGASANLSEALELELVD